MKILHIISDPFAKSESVNKRVAEHFLQAFERLSPEISLSVVDLYQQPPPLLSKVQIDYVWQDNLAKRPSKEIAEAIAYQQQACQQFKQANLIIISAPVWNYNLPAILKAWMDQIICPGQLFEFADSGNQPLHQVSSMVNVISAGGSLSRSGYDRAMLQLLRAAFEFIGIKQFHDVVIEGQEPTLYPDWEQREAAAKQQTSRLAITLYEQLLQSKLSS